MMRQIKLYSIYKITNKINGKCYIGLTSQSVEKRQNQHISHASRRKLNTPFYNAIRKYGAESFECIVIATTTDEKMSNLLEKFYIKVYKSKHRKFGYNIIEGGNGGHRHSHSEETKAKMSLSKRNIPFSEEHKRKLSLARKGKPLSEETKRKISLSNKNRILSKESRQKLVDSHIKLAVMISQHSLSGEYIREYPSITKARIDSGVDSSSISKCCRGKLKSAGGFVWYYVADKDDQCL